MDKQTIYIGSAAVIGFIFGKANTTIRSLIYSGIVVGVVYVLYTHG